VFPSPQANEVMIISLKIIEVSVVIECREAALGIFEILQIGPRVGPG